ncbi:hypothetical protein PHYNN_62 [Pantoea phage Phynn]|nr:hypothetical protein PHYNN_62 [Pantoea phage Phynn]
MSKILIVYELIPEDVEFYLVDTEDKEVIDIVKKCHMHYLNYEASHDVQQALEALNLMLGERDECNIKSAEEIQIDTRFVGLLRGCKVEKSDDPFTFEGGVTVVHTGFAL